MSLTEQQENDLRLKYELQAHDGSPIERLRAHALSHGVCGIRTIGRLFRRFDQNGNKRLDLVEFQDALDEAGIEVDHETQQQCFNNMDLDGTGSVNFDEFLIALRPPMSDSRLELINRAFDKMDRTDTGEVTVDDLCGVYSAEYHPRFQAGEWTEDEVFQHWLQQFGGGHDGTVTRDDFVNYYVGVSSSIDDDEYFELMMRQAWKLDD